MPKQIMMAKGINLAKSTILIDLAHAIFTWDIWVQMCSDKTKKKKLNISMFKIPCKIGIALLGLF